MEQKDALLLIQSIIEREYATLSEHVLQNDFAPFTEEEVRQFTSDAFASSVYMLMNRAKKRAYSNKRIALGLIRSRRLRSPIPELPVTDPPNLLQG